jgi:hypothetical protein
VGPKIGNPIIATIAEGPQIFGFAICGAYLGTEKNRQRKFLMRRKNFVFAKSSKIDNFGIAHRYILIHNL